MKTFLFFFLFTVLFPAPLIFGGGEQELTLYYTASLNGNLEGCDCKGAPKAGLVKRAAFLKDLPSESSSILVDGGDIFEVHADELLADYILEVYDKYGYDAVGIGDQEFSNGPEYLLEKAESFPFVCHNLRVMDERGKWRNVSEGPTVIRKGRAAVGIISVIDPEVFTFYGPDTTDRLEITPPATTAERQAGFLAEQDVSLVLLLYHGYWDHAVETVEAVTGIDVAVVAHEQLLKEPVERNGTVMVSPGEQGNRVGILQLRVEKGRIKEYINRFEYFSYTRDPDDPYVREVINEYYKELTERIKTTE